MFPSLNRFTMLDSQTDVHCGEVLAQYQASNVYPGYREASLGVGTQVFGGTCGTISWQIVELSLRLIVMWSVPFNLNLYDTYLGLAMIYNQVCWIYFFEWNCLELKYQSSPTIRLYPASNCPSRTQKPTKSMDSQ